MDIFRFIDSADIRRYLAEIRYRFSTEEKMLGQFQAADSCVYQYRLAAAGETDSGSVYRSYKDCLAAAIHAAHAANWRSARNRSMRQSTAVG